MAAPPVVGIDFDNTIVSYDELFHELATASGLIPPGCPADKRAIRDTIRARAGDKAWLRLQDLAYGKRMDDAKLINGVADFFRTCQERGVRALIISHKTECSNLEGSTSRLRDAARSWMERHGFFTAAGMGLGPQDVFFESSRAQKIARIAALGCNLFIDDLEETLLDPEFPPTTRRVLFAPAAMPEVPAGITVLKTWQEIHAHVFSPGS